MNKRTKSMIARAKLVSPMVILSSMGIIYATLFTGCASIDQFYSVNPSAQKMELIDYTGPLKAEPVVGMNFDQLITARAADDYYLIGSADYTGRGDLNWRGAMIRLGEKLKAEKVDYFTHYLRTDTISGVTSRQTTNHSTATVWGSSGHDTIDIATTDTEYIPYTYNIQRNEFHVFYFKKMKHPDVFGIEFGAPDEKVARKIGTRNALIIQRVVPKKIAWKNDLFKGDIIMEVNGLKATPENVHLFCKNCNGGKMKIKRSDKEIEITIKVD